MAGTKKGNQMIRNIASLLSASDMLGCHAKSGTAQSGFLDPSCEEALEAFRVDFQPGIAITLDLFFDRFWSCFLESLLPDECQMLTPLYPISKPHGCVTFSCSARAVHLCYAICATVGVTLVTCPCSTSPSPPPFAMVSRSCDGHREPLCFCNHIQV